MSRLMWLLSLLWLGILVYGLMDHLAEQQAVQGPVSHHSALLPA
ncbi:hypothetical protein Mterra_00849 [Calidithermus terrae]|uniref:Uncharacterized protein n=1 Tax=Calidithermus terrae TaxID=1408545 RepID=A0A399F1C9_9DEIN|nr:hypothetical protein [Calidithermus terrae]RIH89079.1 hypothetical protein Mterra_00849 [Calidithermus terrae]